MDRTRSTTKKRRSYNKTNNDSDGLRGRLLSAIVLVITITCVVIFGK